MKLTLGQKSIILVLIPVLLQFLFVWILGFLWMRTEEETSCAFHAAKVADCSNILMRHLLEISSVDGDFSQALSSQWYEALVPTIRLDLDNLQMATKDDPAEQRIVQRSVDAGEEAIILVERTRRALIAGDTLSAMLGFSQSQDELKSCLKRMISRDLIEMAQSEKKRVDETHARQLALTKQIKSLFPAGLICSVIFTVVAAIIFSRKISGRLRLLIDNNIRLANGLPLHPLIGGSDEIANFDAAFHRLSLTLSQSKEKEKLMVEYSVDVICSLDATGRVTAANPACKNILGYSADELLGASLKNILAEKDADAFSTFLKSLMSSDTEAEFECVVRKKDGTNLDMLWSMHWVDSGKSFFCVGHDISAQREMERLKQQLMNMVSHDLRTPLTTIGNYLEMVAAGLFGQLTEKGEDLLKVAENNVNRMLGLIKDLLELERAEFGGFKLDCSMQNLNDILHEAIMATSIRTLQHKIHLELCKTNLVVNADTDRILQVLDTLLRHAIKFSKTEETIIVKVEQSDGMAITHVSEKGRTVPEHLTKAIFDRFQQVGTIDATDQHDIGLGLAVCKVIVELHGGSISLRNDASAGSTFSFSLPLAKASKIQTAF